MIFAAAPLKLNCAAAPEKPCGKLIAPAGAACPAKFAVKVALVAGIAPNVPGFLHVAGIATVPQIFDDLYVYAWFTGFVIGGLVYWLGMRRRAN